MAAPRKEQPAQGVRRGHKRPRTGLLDALIKGRLTAPMLFNGTCNTATFNAWLKVLLAPHLKQDMTIIMDNATFHASAGGVHDAKHEKSVSASVSAADS